MLDLSKLNLPKKKKEILSTANDLFQQFGIKRISVQEICQTAGVSKMTFYKYFDNKNELVRYLWEKGFEQALETFDQIREMEIPFENKLQRMLKLKEETAAKISQQFALDYFYATPDLKDFFEQLAGDSMNHFLDFIKQAQQKGEVRPDMHPEFLLAIINNIKLMVKDDTLISKYPSYKDFVMEVNNFIFYGILPRPNTEES
jgi:AcrR family transcriptional regulator